MKKSRQFLSQSFRVVNAKLVTFWHLTKNLSKENLYHRHFEITTAPLSIIEISKLRLRLSPKTLDKWLHDKKCFPPIKDASKKCLHRSSFERNFITLWKIDLQCAAFMSFSDSRFLLENTELQIQADSIKFLLLFFSQASERAGFLNPRIWLANHVHVTGPAFYDTAHGPDFFPAQRCTFISLLKV